MQTHDAISEKALWKVYNCFQWKRKLNFSFFCKFVGENCKLLNLPTTCTSAESTHSYPECVCKKSGILLLNLESEFVLTSSLVGVYDEVIAFTCQWHYGSDFDGLQIERIRGDHQQAVSFDRQFGRARQTHAVYQPKAVSFSFCDSEQRQRCSGRVSESLSEFSSTIDQETLSCLSEGVRRQTGIEARKMLRKELM